MKIHAILFGLAGEISVIEMFYLHNEKRKLFRFSSASGQCFSFAAAGNELKPVRMLIRFKIKAPSFQL